MAVVALLHLLKRKSAMHCLIRAVAQQNLCSGSFGGFHTALVIPFASIPAAFANYAENGAKFLDGVDGCRQKPGVIV